jgi:hypothetical protein
MINSRAPDTSSSAADAVMTLKNLTIAILDDEPDRLTAMRPLLAERFPHYEVETFDNAPDMIAWLHQHLSKVALVSLDHDLGPDRRRNGRKFDPGIGRDVADYLSTSRPQCPVILHTTNRQAIPGMLEVLGESGWQATSVIPYGDLDWVRKVWIEEVVRVMCAQS